MDRFTVTEDSGGIRIGQKPLSNSEFNWLREFVESESPDGNCPSLTITPDVSIVRTRGNSKKNVKIYIGESVLNVDNKCSQLKGDGVYRFPMTRVWYIGKTELAIFPSSLGEFQIGGKTIRYRRKSPTNYILVSGPFYPHWEKVKEFERDITKYNVEGRRRLGIVEGKYNFQYKTNGKTYTFYEIAPRVWGVKYPGTKWVILSKDFKWGAYSLNDFKNPFSDSLRTFRNKSASEKDRLNSIETLKKTWNQSLQKAFIAVLLDESEPPFLRRQVAESLLQKPVLKNKQALVKTLITTKSDTLQEYISRRMRLFHPSGEILTRKDSSSVRARKLRGWRDWIRTQR